MHFTKIFIVLALSLAIGFLGCAEQKAAPPTEERITKDLVPPKAEVKGPTLLVELSDLKVDMTQKISSKEIVGTPTLRGNIKITNKSKDVLNIQAITLEYLDDTGKPVPNTSDEEKIGQLSSFWGEKGLQPEGTVQGSLNVAIPKSAIKGKPFKKIDIKVAYVSVPLKQENLTLSEKLE